MSNFVSYANGVFLPMEASEYAGSASLHIGGHSEEYIDTVTDYLKNVTELGGGKQEIIDVLSEIREELLDGTIELNKAGN